MSLRIQNDLSSGVNPSEIGRGNQISGSDSAAGRTGPFSSLPTAGGDHFSVSSTTESISSGLSASAAQQASRVKQLAALYSGGQYNVDATQISQAIVNSAVTQSFTPGNA